MSYYVDSSSDGRLELALMPDDSREVIYQMPNGALVTEDQFKNLNRWYRFQWTDVTQLGDNRITRLVVAAGRPYP